MKKAASRAFGTIALTIAISVPAQAEKLFSVWTLEPMTETGEQSIAFDGLLLEQRLLPFRAVTLTSDAVAESGKTTPAGTALFLVAQDDGQQAYCTMKDRSTGNVAKSFFIPALDKRPCFVDADGDGFFESSFNVFDKYGSALAPSGQLKKAEKLQGTAAYQEIAPSEFPATFRLTYLLYGKRDVEKAQVSVGFDNGSGKSEAGIARSERDGASLATMNASFRFLEIDDETARVLIKTDDTAYLVGNSGGSFELFETPPAYLGG